jgi:hypothetical protein
LTIPAISTGTFTVNWGDGFIDSNTRTHTYSTLGTYTIQITASTLTSVKPFTNSILTNTTNIPQIGNSLIDMSGMFLNCTNIPSQVQTDMASWNTSRVATMQAMFNNATNFNGSVSNWNTINVLSMLSMFNGATSFNRPLNWNTSNVATMQAMFQNTTSFNQPLNWNTSNVLTMRSMFSTSNFNSPITFTTSRVSDLSFMFTNAIYFSQPLILSDTSNATTMTSMFQNAPSFNQPLVWNTSNVSSMQAMFYGATSFNQSLNWNTSNVADMGQMFRNATSMSDTSYESLKNWNVSKVDSFSLMFTVKMSNVTMSNILVGWATNGVKPNLTLGASSDQRAINTLCTPPSSAPIPVRSYYEDQNWTFPVATATFFSATS